MKLEFKPTDFLFIEESDDSPFDLAMLFTDAVSSSHGIYHLTDRHRGGGFVSRMDGSVEYMARPDMDAEIAKLFNGSDPWYLQKRTRFNPN
jgi:hypothetical protein